MKELEGASEKDAAAAAFAGKRKRAAVEGGALSDASRRDSNRQRGKI
jgi:hypothetical protein